MDTYAMSVAACAAAAVPQTATQTTDAASADVSFSQLLSTLTGTDMNATGMTWRDIQNGMMTDAMKVLQNAEKPLATDPAMAQLIQMLKALGVDADAGKLAQLMEKMKKRLEELVEEEGVEMAGAQVLALLGVMAEQFPTLEFAQATEELLANGDGEAALEFVAQSTPGEIAGMLKGHGEQMLTEARTTQATETVELPKANPQETKISQEEGGVQVTGQTSAKSEEAAIAAPQDFEAAVRAAKEQMVQKPAADAKGKTEVDVDELQQQVNAGLFLQNTGMASAAPAETQAVPNPVQVPVAEQVSEGILTAAANGADEVTIKLNPEELGEVTVKLARTEEGMTLNIIAKNPETVRALNGEIQALQDGLKPLEVKVENVITEQQYELLSQQQFGGQHQRSFEEMHGAAYYKDTPLGETEEAEVARPAGKPTTVLDAYV